MTRRIALFDLAERRLAWADQRQGLLAQNIANADTPGWRAREVSPFAAQLGNADAALVQTSPLHIAPAASAAGIIRTSGLHAPDGNGVAMDEQLAKVTETETIHDLVGDLYKKYLGFFKLAIGR